MKNSILIFIVFSSFLFGQAGSSAVPFLLISPSVEANGMGGMMTVANSSSPTSMMFNPAHLGMNSQLHFLSSELYTHNTRWLPEFRLSDLWINNYSIMYGMKLFNEDNSNISIGFGYSRMFLNLGEFVVISDVNYDVIDRFNGYESSDNYSVGMGMDLGFTLAFGITIKKIVSSLSPIGTAQEKGSAQANIWAADIGLLFKFPMLQYIDKQLTPNRKQLSPFTDLTFAYALNNLGGRVHYGEVSQSDPLPRNARVGLSIESGIDYNSEREKFGLIKITIAREAENLLFSRGPNGASWEYSGAPLGNINIYKNVIASEVNGYISVRRGASVSMFETVTYRQGSYEGDGNLSYATTGYSVSSRGISKLIGSRLNKQNEFNPVQFLFSHFEIRFSHSEYSGQTVLDRTSFDNITVSFHH